MKGTDCMQVVGHQGINRRYALRMGKYVNSKGLVVMHLAWWINTLALA